MADYVIIDVREAEEYTGGHVMGAINLPLTGLMSGTTKLNDVPKDAKIIVYCRTGSRSQVAMNILHNMGYDNITNGINQAQVEAKLL